MKKSKWLSKPILFVATLIISFALVCAGSLAWFTTEVGTLNPFENQTMNAAVEEVFISNEEMKPGQSTVKQVWVTNTEQMPVIVRVSLEEILATFTVDDNQQLGGGTGNLKLVSSGAAFNPDDVSTWLQGRVYPAYKSVRVGGSYEKQYVAQDSAVPPNPTQFIQVATNGVLGSTRYGRLATVPTGLLDSKLAPTAQVPVNLMSYIQLNFNASVRVDAQNPASPDWVYYNGYFYYTKILEAGQATDTPLLEGLKLSVMAPNMMKGFWYQLTPVMEASTPLKVVMENAWGVTPGAAGAPETVIYNALAQYLRD